MTEESAAEQPAVSGDADSTGETEQEQPVERTYSQAEYDALKEESIKHRKASKLADTFRDALRQAACKQASSGVLHEPIQWSDDFDGEDGLPDHERITEAVAALAESKPWMTRVRGDAGIGFRGDDSDADVDLVALMRG
ncbi:hypothetical protein [Nocardioides jensenii]|uniref:hypothetical protein n=1 Tax=Nocardioides jensenii TaxID=1843 RepID=UPI000832D99C|nr:hypothetical protein [Nocardioides jensenii]